MGEFDDLIIRAIRAGAKAGVYRRAGRLNPARATTYAVLAAPYTAQARTLLTEAVRSPGHAWRRRCPCCGEE